MSRSLGVTTKRPVRAFQVTYAVSVYASTYLEAAEHVDKMFKDGRSHHIFSVTDLNARKTWDIDASDGRKWAVKS